MIGLVVDSNSQLPASLSLRYGIRVVPLTIAVDGVEFREGVDLDEHWFYEAMSSERGPVITTSQPSPGQFVEAYEAAIAGGATEILSIHLTEAMSGTINSARLAADMVPVPVRVLDSGTASFGISCCAWAAAEVIADGGSVDDAVAVSMQRSADLGSAFIVGVPALADRSGRIETFEVERAAADGIPVLSMHRGDIAVLDTVTTVQAAVEAMRDYVVEWPPSSTEGLRVAIGTSDISSGAVSADLTDALRGHPAIHEIVQYTIGPSVGAHLGPGSAGVFVF